MNKKKTRKTPKIDRRARKAELAKLLGGRGSQRGTHAKIDPNRLVKVTLNNGSSFWDHPVKETELAYEFDRMGLIPKEQVRSLYFWRKPSDREMFIKAVFENDAPPFSPTAWMKQLGGK
jgi:hypothetical protein